MAKSEFARGTLTYSGEIGVTDVTIDDTYSEIDVTDTLTTYSYSEFLGGRRSISVSFSTFKSAGVDDKTLNASASMVLKVEDSAGAYTNYTGNLILLSKSIAGTIDDAVKVSYSGRISGALSETQNS
jgi:predicted secreted protein